ncbi:MAG: hypothetical protein WC513_08920, partial [Bacteroidales bacterium]
PSISGFQAGTYQLNSFFGLRDSDLRGPERNLTSVRIDTWTSQDGLGNSIPDDMIVEITDYHDGSALLKINKSLFDAAIEGLTNQDYLFAKLVVSEETAVLLGMTIGGIKETQGGNYYWPLVDFTQVTGTFPGTIPGTYPLKAFLAKVDSDLRGPERQIGNLSLTSWGGFALKDTRGGAGAVVCVYTPAIPLMAGLITSSIGDYTQSKQQTKAKTQMVLDPVLTMPQSTTSVAVIDDEKSFEDYARETIKVIGGILLLPFCLTGCGPTTPQTPLDIPGIDNGPFDIPEVPEPTPTPDGQEPPSPEDFRIPSVSIDGLMALQRDRGNYLAVMFNTDNLKQGLRREANKVMDAFVAVGWSVDRNNFRVEGSDLVVDILTSAGQHYTAAISDILKDGFIVVVLPQERATYDLSWSISLADALEEIEAEPTFMNTVEVSRLNSLLPDNDNLCSYADVYGDLVVFIDKTIFENMVNQILNTPEFQGIPLSDILLHVQVAYHGGRLVYGGYTDVLNIRQYNYGIGADISEMPIEEGEDSGLLPQGPFELRYQLSTLGAIPGDRHNAFPALDESLRPASNVEITYETNQAGEDIFAIDIATLEADMVSKGIPVGLDDYTLQIGRIYAAGALIDSFSVASLKTLNPGDPIKHPAFYNNEDTIAVGETTGPYQYFFRYVKTIRISPWEEIISAVTLNPPSAETFSQEYSLEHRQLLIHADMASLDSDLTSQNPPIPFGARAIELSAEGLSPDIFWTRNEFSGQPGNTLGVDLSAAPGFVKMRYVYGTRVSPWEDVIDGFARLNITAEEPCFASAGGIGGPVILTMNISPLIATAIASSVFASADADRDASVVTGERTLDKATVIRFHGAKPWDGDRLKIMKFLFANKGHKLANFAEMFNNAEVFDASDETPGGYERAKQEAMRASKEGRPLVILGYSNMGGLWGKFLGPGFLEELGNAEVDIDLLILFDDSGHHKIPANVKEVVNIYTLQPVPVLCLLDIIWFSTFSGVEITRNMVAEPQNTLIVNFEFDKKTSNLKRTSKEDIADFEKGKYTQLVSNIYLPTRGHMDVPLNKGPEAEVYHRYIGERLLVAAERVFSRRSEREMQEKARMAEQQRVELARQKVQKEHQARIEETAREIKESQERIRQLDIQLAQAEAARTSVAYRGTLDYLIPRVNADVDFAEQARLAALADNTRDIDEPRFASAGGIGGPLVLTMNTYEIVSTVQQNISTTLAAISTAMMGAFNQPATTQEAAVEPVVTQPIETQPAAAEEATSKSMETQDVRAPIEELAQPEIEEQKQKFIKTLTPETTIDTEAISVPTRRIIEVQTSHSLIEGIGRIVSLASPESGKPNMITFIYNDGVKEEFTLRELAEKIAFLTEMEISGISADLGEGFGAAVSLSKAKDTFAQLRLLGYAYQADLITLTLMYLAYQEGSLQAEGQEINPQAIDFAQVERIVPYARLGEILKDNVLGLGVLNPNQTNSNIHHDRVVIEFKNGEKRNYSYTELAKALGIELVALHKDLLGTVVKADVSINGVILKKVNLKDILAAGFAKTKGFESAKSDMEFIEEIGKRAAEAQQAIESQPSIQAPEIQIEPTEQEVDEPKLPELRPELEELDEMMHQQFEVKPFYNDNNDNKLASPIVSEQDSSAAPDEEKDAAAEPTPSIVPIASSQSDKDRINPYSVVPAETAEDNIQPQEVVAPQETPTPTTQSRAPPEGKVEIEPAAQSQPSSKPIKTFIGTLKEKTKDLQINLGLTRRNLARWIVTAETFFAQLPTQITSAIAEAAQVQPVVALAPNPAPLPETKTPPLAVYPVETQPDAQVQEQNKQQEQYKQVAASKSADTQVADTQVTTTTQSTQPKPTTIQSAAPTTGPPAQTQAAATQETAQQEKLAQLRAQLTQIETEIQQERNAQTLDKQEVARLQQQRAELAKQLTDLEKAKQSETQPVSGTTGEITLAQGKPSTIEVVNTNRGFILVAYDEKGNPQPTFFLGGAVQYTGESHVSAYHKNFLPIVTSVERVAEQLTAEGHDAIRIYLPPNNLTSSDAADLKEFISRLYKKYGIRTYILHFAGLYADPEGEFLLRNPTDKNLARVKGLIKELAKWARELGPAVAGIQLGNENDYYVPGASTIRFGGSNPWDTVNLSAQEYHRLMNELAEVYKSIDNTHPVFLGHGNLSQGQIPLLKDNLSHFDGIALNVYPNWGEGRPSQRVMNVNELVDNLRGQIEIAKELGKPVVLGEFGESSYGKLGQKGQAEFAHNVAQALAQFMTGSDSKYAHLVVGLFWHEYFGERWKNKDIHASESDLELFDKNFKAKPAFVELSKGYREIKERLLGLLKPRADSSSAPQTQPAVNDAEIDEIKAKISGLESKAAEINSRIAQRDARIKDLETQRQEIQEQIKAITKSQPQATQPAVKEPIQFAVYGAGIEGNSQIVSLDEPFEFTYQGEQVEAVIAQEGENFYLQFAGHEIAVEEVTEENFGIVIHNIFSEPSTDALQKEMQGMNREIQKKIAEIEEELHKRQEKTRESEDLLNTELKKLEVAEQRTRERIEELRQLLASARAVDQDRYFHAQEEKATKMVRLQELEVRMAEQYIYSIRMKYVKFLQEKLKGLKLERKNEIAIGLGIGNFGYPVFGPLGIMAEGDDLFPEGRLLRVASGIVEQGSTFTPMAAAVLINDVLQIIQKERNSTLQRYGGIEKNRIPGGLVATIDGLFEYNSDTRAFEKVYGDTLKIADFFDLNNPLQFLLELIGLKKYYPAIVTFGTTEIEIMDEAFRNTKQNVIYEVMRGLERWTKTNETSRNKLEALWKKGKVTKEVTAEGDVYLSLEYDKCFGYRVKGDGAVEKVDWDEYVTAYIIKKHLPVIEKDGSRQDWLLFGKDIDVLKVFDNLAELFFKRLNQRQR